MKGHSKNDSPLLTVGPVVAAGVSRCWPMSSDPVQVIFQLNTTTGQRLALQHAGGRVHTGLGRRRDIRGTNAGRPKAGGFQGGWRRRTEHQTDCESPSVHSRYSVSRVRASVSACLRMCLRGRVSLGATVSPPTARRDDNPNSKI